MPSLKASTETSACFWISLRSRLARAHARSNAAVVGHHASCPFLRTLERGTGRVPSGRTRGLESEPQATQWGYIITSDS